MAKDGFTLAVALLIVGAAETPGNHEAELTPNGGFENGFAGWTRWGRNADRIGLDEAYGRPARNCAKIQYGHSALYFTVRLAPDTAYELRVFYRLAGGNPSAQIALGYMKKDGPLNSAGREVIELKPPTHGRPGEWSEFRKVFMPTVSTESCQVAFSARAESTLWIDDVSLRAVARPPELMPPPDPWEGLSHRTANPLFAELLGREPGRYSVVCWSHDLQRKNITGPEAETMKDDETWRQVMQTILQESGEAGMGFLDLPGALDGREPWRTAEFHREHHRRYGVTFDVWCEGSASVEAGVRNGAEVLNPSEAALGKRPSLSWVDPKYVAAQEDILRRLARRFRDEPYVGVFCGKDEPRIHLPEGPPSRWGEYGRTMAREVLETYGSGRFEAPRPGDRDFESDPHKPLRWIAYNRWMNEAFHESRCRLRQAVHEIAPEIRYSAADCWFMSGFVPFDYSRLGACSDVMDLDPYASSAERRRGRGVYQHGFGAKFMSDLSGKPVRIVAQAFDYAGYDMTPDDLREWLSQALRCGASGFQYYTLDCPRWTHRDRWNMMLHLSRVITRMNRLDLPTDPDTAILYTLYTHMSHGASTGGDPLYAAHVLVGERAGSWFRFVCDAQLERGEAPLHRYRAVYLPLAGYMTEAATKSLEEYVRTGGTLICGDAEAFSFDPAGNDTRAARERILGVRTAGNKHADRIVLRSETWGIPAGSALRLFDIKVGDEAPAVRAREIQVMDAAAEILGVYPDGSPALVRRALGKGHVVTFAANPFAPQVAVDASLWPVVFKGLQRSLGCEVERPVWRFALPAPR